MEPTPEKRQFALWIDPSGEVWIEDPDAAMGDFAAALQPGFRFGAAEWVLPPPRFEAARHIEAPRPWPASLEGLWQLHDGLVAAWAPSETPVPPGASLLDLKRAIAGHLLKSCVLCEHRCAVDRTAGERGRCRVGAVSFVSEAYAHQAEEREVAPSLCVTLTGCSWHCVYCHTHEIINRVDAGTPLEAPYYAELYAKALAPGVRTLSFVGGNPDHHLAAVLDFLAAAPAGFDRPVVWNSNMYGSPELYRLLDGIVDVYLGDFRYGNDACASRLSGLERCWEPVTRNWRLAGAQNALAIARILILPGHLACCVEPMLDWLAEHLGHARVSLLDQYHPGYLVAKRAPELDRRPSESELATARAMVAERGLNTVQAVGPLGA